MTLLIDYIIDKFSWLLLQQYNDKGLGIASFNIVTFSKESLTVITNNCEFNYDQKNSFGWVLFDQEHKHMNIDLFDKTNDIIIVYVTVSNKDPCECEKTAIKIIDPKQLHK